MFYLFFCNNFIIYIFTIPQISTGNTYLIFCVSIVLTGTCHFLKKIFHFQRLERKGNFRIIARYKLSVFDVCSSKGKLFEIIVRCSQIVSCSLSLYELNHLNYIAKLFPFFQFKVLNTESSTLTDNSHYLTKPQNLPLFYIFVKENTFLLKLCLL